MIKAVILDVDGVIVGNKAGYNFPNPHPDVITALKNVHAKGIPICLCTAKPSFAALSIIEAAQLNNLHITDGGATVIDPIDGILAAKHAIDAELCQKIISIFYQRGVYQELYTPHDYYILRQQLGPLTEKHNQTLQLEQLQILQAKVYGVPPHRK